ncbi:tyrosine-protein phosphatase [Bacillus cereus]|uniref:tyrosine-protein phosphatase n=1 Tax=Bacillus cereus TaxID=1396 RepID=UPI002AC1E281|nr:tyrosine-protein phosphatase [Bacillus cereus]MDZ4481524.1 tyrosine-protein phosphatase [Bacillus cereus]MDZ4497378.1 tyrosine-protein phosphatase [Bacillus cereus]MDZ4519242.1 tyrosine-protein phosphatase [Bacillus cereus]MDZ4583426.1 tyrosine-protein phosphatase [Bacillus cereus]
MLGEYSHENLNRIYIIGSDILHPTNLKIKSALNFRPLGSNIPNLNKGLVYRSGSLSQLNYKDMQRIKETGIKKYFDFRSEEEILEKGTPITLQSAGIQLYQLPISGYHEAFEKKLYPTYEDYAFYYMDILECGRESLNKVIKTISYDDLPIAYGCSAGKDRTGVASAVILKAIGISDQRIGEDYEQTATYLLPEINQFESFWKKIGISKEDYIGRITTKKDTIYLFLELVQRKYGSVFNYLYEIGITDKDIKLMKKRLLKEW